MKNWDKPKLIVLIRGNPEEMVLSSCKVQWIGGAAPDAAYCKEGPLAGCAACSSVGGS